MVEVVVAVVAVVVVVVVMVAVADVVVVSVVQPSGQISWIIKSGVKEPEIVIGLYCINP